MHVRTVAAALHPFMLSKWRKDVKDGRLRGRPPKAPPVGPAREIAQLQRLERQYAELKEEHDLLETAIRFWSARKATGSRSSRISSRRVDRSTTVSKSRPCVGDTASRGRASMRGATVRPVRARSRTGN